MYKKEKEQMRSVDGFTLVDYVKECIEILMNMKMEGGSHYEDQMTEEDSHSS